MLVRSAIQGSNFAYCDIYLTPLLAQQCRLLPSPSAEELLSDDGVMNIHQAVHDVWEGGGGACGMYNL